MAIYHWRHSSSEAQIKGFVVLIVLFHFCVDLQTIQGLAKSSWDLKSDIWTKHCGPSMMWLLKPRHQIESKSSITMPVIHRFFSLSIVLGLDQAQVRCWTTILDLTSAREPSTSAVRFRLLGHNAECCSFVLRRSGEFSLAGNILSQSYQQVLRYVTMKASKFGCTWKDWKRVIEIERVPLQLGCGICFRVTREKPRTAWDIVARRAVYILKIVFI